MLKGNRKLPITSWIEGRRPEHEDFNIIERTSTKSFKFSLPWYASTINDDHDVFFPLEDVLGRDSYDGYNERRESMRQTTMLEF
jgi:hypothetical protein